MRRVVAYFGRGSGQPWMLRLLICWPPAGPAALLLVLPLANVGLAAPPPHADRSLAPWYEGLKDPATGGSCCGESDCRHFPVRIMDDHYEVLFNGNWMTVPAEHVLEQLDNPTGDYVACIRSRYEDDRLSPKVTCFVRRPGL